MKIKQTVVFLLGTVFLLAGCAHSDDAGNPDSPKHAQAYSQALQDSQAELQTIQSAELNPLSRGDVVDHDICSREDTTLGVGGYYKCSVDTSQLVTSELDAQAAIDVLEATLQEGNWQVCEADSTSGFGSLTSASEAHTEATEPYLASCYQKDNYLLRISLAMQEAGGVKYLQGDLLTYEAFAAFVGDDDAANNSYSWADLDNPAVAINFYLDHTYTGNE